MTSTFPPQFSPERTLIAPSILSADFANLQVTLETLEQRGADWIHVDVMDGMFVPNITLGPPIVSALRPHSTLPFDVHLMIEDPDRYLEAFQKAGADIITVHFEACKHLHRTLSEIRALGCKAGVSLTPATPVSVLQDVMDNIDMILIMSVNPGFGGQSFIPRSIHKLREAKALIGDRPIFLEVDGGISPKNAAEVREAGANVLVSGSAVFSAPDMAQAIQAMKA